MTEVINSISDFEKYLKDTKKVVEEALDFSLGPENPKILQLKVRKLLLLEEVCLLGNLYHLCC